MTSPVAPMATPTAKPKPGALAWIGCSCCVVLLVAGIAVAIASGLAVAAAKGFAFGVARDAVDARVYRERAIAILRPHELPPGYQAVGGVRIPFVLQAAALSGSGDSLFLYLNAAPFLDPGAANDPEAPDSEGPDAKGSDPEEWLNNAPWARAARISIQAGPVLDRQILPIEGGSAQVSSYRGTITVAGQTRSGPMSVLRLECDHDQRFREAVWITPLDSRDPDSASTSAAQLMGTAADPVAVADMIGRFRLCPGN